MHKIIIQCITSKQVPMYDGSGTCGRGYVRRADAIMCTGAQ